MGLSWTIANKSDRLKILKSQLSKPKKVSSHRLTHIAKQLEKRSGNHAATLRALSAAELLPSDLNRDNHRIDSHKEAKFLQAAVAILEDTSFATSAGLNFSENSSIIAYIAKYSQDVSRAIENASKYAILTDQNSSFRLITSSNAASFQIHCHDGELALQPRHREFLIFASLATMRTITGRRLFPVEIRFQHSAPTAHSTITNLAGCPVVFNSEQTEILLPHASLDWQIPTYDPHLLRHLTMYADDLMAHADTPNPGIRELVEKELASALPGKHLSAPEVAASLGLGHRTLTRRLADTGANFSAIADRLRQNLAKTYLTQSDAPILEIAFLLDYSDQAGFTTAFKRWTGQTPKAYRSKQHAARA